LAVKDYSDPEDGVWEPFVKFH